MTFLSFALVAYSAFTGAASISGHLSASDGAALAGVRVFAESGLGGALLEATAAPDGQFRFEGVPSGIVGIFAIAEGRGWSGVSRTVAGSDDITGLSLVLQPAGTVSGKVVDPRGKPVSGAHVTRILLQGVDKAGIPLAKLAALGFAEPITDDSGVFSVPNLPKDGKVALKVAHIAYAQTAVQDLAVGAANAKVTLMEGILVQGTVLTWDSSSAVANTAVLFRSAVAPHDTAVAVTDSTGEFHLRLMPGIYAYQASGAELRSPGWQRVTVTGAESVQSVSVRVAGSALLRGSVQDAITGAPIEGARLSLTVYGNPSAVATTGKSGMYEFTGSQGENVISVDAASGYRRPDRPILNVQAKQGDTLELPTFWMTRLPAFSVRVLDEAGAPVSGAVVRLIRPMQYRWYITGADGRTELQIAASPPGDRLVGMVEHMTEPRGALFAMDMKTENEAAVQLLSWARATGKVVNGKGKGLQGVVVGAIFQGDADSELLPLWRTVTRADGQFSWDAVPPLVSSVCVARSGEGQFARSEVFTATQGQASDIGAITLPDPKKGVESMRGKSLLGSKLAWNQAAPSGSTAQTPEGKPALLVYCSVEEAALVVDGLDSIVRALGPGKIIAAAIVDGDYAGTPEQVRILKGKAPASASTYLLDGAGAVVLETVGLPPAFAFRNATAKE